MEIGGYCGYSALRFVRTNPGAKVLTIEINEHYADIARKIQQHAGVGDQIKINIGNVEQS